MILGASVAAHSGVLAHPPIVGRFAPSPSGPLHFGSLVAAAGSYLDAKSRGGRWLVRMEDLDPYRTLPSAAGEILRTLEAFGFAWDGPVVYQSQRSPAYRQALETLRSRAAIYPCGCSRKEIAELAVAGVGVGYVYPGTCRDGLPQGKSERALRLRVADEVVGFDDNVQGRFRQNLAEQAGDFVVMRADGVFAYPLAVVVDDAAQGVTHVVRGADLLAATPRQIYLQKGLDLPTPAYAHLPVAVNEHGQKLGKQTRAAPLDPARPGEALFKALVFLGQGPPAELFGADPGQLWAWGLKRWRLAQVCRVVQMPCGQAAGW